MPDNPNPADPYAVTDEEVARDRARDRAAQKVGWQDVHNLPKLTPEGACHHCGSSRAHLYLVPNSLPEPDLAEYQCRTCGRTSYAQESRRSRS